MPTQSISTHRLSVRARLAAAAGQRDFAQTAVVSHPDENIEEPHRLSVRATRDLRLLLARVMPASDGVAPEPLDASDASGAAAAEPPPPESFLVQLRGSVQRPMEVLAAGPV